MPSVNLGELHEWMQQLSSVESAERLTELCRSFCHELGFESFIYALRAPTSFSDAHVVQISGYPEPWLDRYWDKGYFALDPVIEYCSHHVLPIAWEQLVPRSSAANRQVMNEASEFGLRSGISMPMHGPHGELGIMSFAQTSSPTRARRSIEHAMPVVQLLAGYVHEAVRRVSGLVEEDPPARLSVRERDCLRWASDGKTSWEISKLLNISERTVNFHLDNSAAKLKAVSRQHAIAKAIALRILNPHPF